MIGREGVLVVDSRDTEEHARALIDQIRRLTDLPVRYLVNSHWHWDHVNGNQTFRAAYPEVEIVGHPETARLMTREGRDRLADEIRRVEERGARLRRYRSQGATDDGRPLTDEDRSRIEEILGADERPRAGRGGEGGGSGLTVRPSPAGFASGAGPVCLFSVPRADGALPPPPQRLPPGPGW